MFRKNGKLFGKISVVDILALLLIAVLVFGVYQRFGGSKTDFVSGNTYECVMKVKNVRNFTVDALAKGGEVYDKTTKEHIGTIVGVTSEAASEPLLMADGSHVMAPEKDRYHAYVTVEFTGKESGDGYYTESNQQISVGGTLVVQAKWAECEATIVEVHPKD